MAKHPITYPSFTWDGEGPDILVFKEIRPEGSEHYEYRRGSVVRVGRRKYVAYYVDPVTDQSTKMPGSWNTQQRAKDTIFIRWVAEYDAKR